MGADFLYFQSRKLFVGYVRNFIFGVEDGLVSTVGLLSGIAAAGASKHSILLTGLVLIFVEAFSMAMGSFLSEYSAEEYIDGKSVSLRYSIIAGIIMFFSYFIAGFIPLFPYFIISFASAFWLSIILSLTALFILGFVSAKTFKVNVWRSSLRMFVVGGIAISIGALVGKLV